MGKINKCDVCIADKIATEAAMNGGFESIVTMRSAVYDFFNANGLRTKNDDERIWDIAGLAMRYYNDLLEESNIDVQKAYMY